MAVEAGRRALSGSPGAVQSADPGGEQYRSPRTGDSACGGASAWASARWLPWTSLPPAAASSSALAVVLNGWLCSGAVANRVLVTGARTPPAASPTRRIRTPLRSSVTARVPWSSRRAARRLALGSVRPRQRRHRPGVPPRPRRVHGRSSHGQVPLSQQAYMRMEGREHGGRHAVRRMSASCRTACELAGWDTDSVTAVDRSPGERPHPHRARPAAGHAAREVPFQHRGGRPRTSPPPSPAPGAHRGAPAVPGG